LTRNHSREFNRVVRFVLVGGLNTVFGFLIFSLALLVTDSPLFAIIFATVVGVCFNRFTTGRMVFGSSESSFFRFGFVYLASMGMNYVIFRIFHVLIESRYICQALAMIPTAAMTYVLLKKFVFIQSNDAEPLVDTGTLSGSDGPAEG
jgi:putative flippase GtrA